MEHQKPPFTITPAIIGAVADIAELVGKISITSALRTSPMLRRANRIQTIHASLAIEQNTLSLEQVTALLDGKFIIAPPKDIAEVKNAYEIYEHLDSLDPYDMDELLRAHGVLTKGLVPESGMFRSGPVGVVDAEGNVLHVGTLPPYIDGLIYELLTWTQESPLHMLIKSCVFHYEFELIHPFSDGNGRMGRLWHTLLLSKWNPLFAWLPVETIIHDRQQEYYDAINSSNYDGQSTSFICFMLSAIKEALEQAQDSSSVHHLPKTNTSSSKIAHRWNLIQAFLQSNSVVTNGDVQHLLGVSPATANRVLNTLVSEEKLIRVRQGSYWAYVKPESKHL